MIIRLPAWTYNWTGFGNTGGALHVEHGYRTPVWEFNPLSAGYWYDPVESGFIPLRVYRAVLEALTNGRTYS